MGDEETKTGEPRGLSTATFSRMGNLISADTPVIGLEDVLMYKEKVGEPDTKNLVPYVILLDAQFKSVVQKKKREDIVYIVLKGGAILAAILVLIYLAMKAAGALGMG